MKKLLSLIICLIIIPVLILGGALAAVYYTYFNPTPAEYEYLNPQSEVSMIEYANVSLESGVVTTKSFGFVGDTAGFLADLDALECHDGLSFEAIKVLLEDQSIEGIVINYKDGSYEVITPYFSVNSETKLETVEDILNAKIYGYDVEAFRAMLQKHKTNDIPLV